MLKGKTIKLSWSLFILILIVFLAGGWLLGNRYQWRNGGIVNVAADQPGELKNISRQLPDYIKDDADFQLFWDTWNLLKEHYYQKDISDNQLFYGAVSGLVASLGDPYSVFMTPEDSRDFANEIEGSFEGIGAEIAVKNRQVTVVAPLPDTPALAAGLKAGDVIVNINDKSTENMSVNEAVSLIRGKRGTTVKLTIFRKGDTDFREIKITRDRILVKSVTWEFQDNVAILKIRQFNDDTDKLINDFVFELAKQKNIQGVVVDLRNNPGGYLQTAVNVAGEWKKGKVVVSEKLRNGEEMTHQSDKEARLAGYKTVLLVNEGSASASEIVAGALKDWQVATLVGKQTFGKGSVQDLTELRGGATVKLTVAKWFTPNGLSIDEAGIAPDVEVDLTEDDYNNDRDPQLAKAIELLK